MTAPNSPGPNSPGPNTLTPDTPVLAATRMARRLTTPFARGADTLDLRLSLLSSSEALVEAYDFADHLARFGTAPEPSYVLTAARDLAADVTVGVRYQQAGADPVDLPPVPVPAGTLAGTSILLDVPVSPTVRILKITMVDTPQDNAPQDWWRLTALLGTSAKLLWVLGAERDQLRAHAARTLAQRHLPTAIGLSLDLIGLDLGVPRFPPLPYGFDDGTVALYHLDDTGITSTVADVTAAYPDRTGHPGTRSGSVRIGLAGRYDRAMGFPDADATIEVPAGPAFDIGEDSDATIEFFVRLDPAADRAPGGRTDGPVLSRRATPDLESPGWAFEVGRFDRGIARNIRFTVSDGDPVRTVTLYADVSLPTDSFTHVAAVLNRSSHRLSLFVDGELRDWTFFTPFGAVASTAPLLIGAAGGGFRGLVDEVRISSVARTGFAPALGEDDDHYRRRLELFRHWTLPTPARLTALLNQVTGPIGGHRDALVVDDTNATLVRGTRLVRVRPVSLLPGQSIDAAGRRGTDEAAVVGTAAAERDTFDPAYLRGDGAGNLMQTAVRRRLDTLSALTRDEPGPDGTLRVAAGYDPAAPDLRATGRGVLIGHSTVAPGRLAALAHRAGFDFVRYVAGPSAGPVYVACAPSDYFDIESTAAASGSADPSVGDTVTLSLIPPPPADATVRWLLVPGDVGRGVLAPIGAAQSTATLAPVAAGRLIVKAEVRRGTRTVSATRALRLGPGDLAPSATIAADGTLGAPASSVDDPDAFFHRAFLAGHDDPRVDYGTVTNHHSMQPAVRELLDALLAELDRREVTGTLSVVAAYDPDGGLAEKQGRRLELRHSTLTPGALARVAFAAGFSHLENAGSTVVAVQAPGQLVMVSGPPAAEHDGIIEVDEGAEVELTVAPTVRETADAGVPGPLPGAGPELTWARGTYDTAGITLGSGTSTTRRLAAGAAGMAWVQASYLIGGAAAPYTFQVRLRPEADTDATVITKDQHDLIMNVLNTLHPVGVEAATAAVRAHVVELRGDAQQAANPDYTYPKFRVRGRLPRQVKGPFRG